MIGSPFDSRDRTPAQGRSASVTVVEVGPRDGLQNEAVTIASADKAQFVDLLSAAGLPVIEVAAFVSPKWVPQMADAEEVFARLTRREETRYAALVPNLAGLERARAAGVGEVGVFAAASETFSRKNTNQSIEESLATYREVCARAAELGIRVRGYVSTAFGCPFEGQVPPERVAEICGALIEMGAFEVAVSDTIGIAHPGQVPQVLAPVAKSVPLHQIALHFHDTRGTALANVLTALDLGVATFDSSAGGLGGCPYAPGATGNLATEDLVYMLDGLGIRTGVDLDALVEASRFMEPRVGHPLPSRYYRATKSRVVSR
jgi:hydroxymethylglutaryl-CoA lyase